MKPCNESSMHNRHKHWGMHDKQKHLGFNTTHIMTLHTRLKS
jgi:hypothetical protein